VPILVRPVREQLEHDRVIRNLQAKLKRKYEVIANVGDEKNASIKSGTQTLFPDLVLNSPDRGRRLAGIIEVETTESVNHLEAMAEWANFGRARVPFYLYVPAGCVEMARRLCADQNVAFAEISSYHAIGDQIRFVVIHRAPAPAPVKQPARSATPRAAARPRSTAAARKPAARTAAKRTRSAASTRTTGRAQKRK
jgi:hypothetical protein